MNSNQVRNIILALVALMILATGLVWWLSSQSEPQPVKAPVPPTPVQTIEPVEEVSTPAPIAPEVIEPELVLEEQVAPEPLPVEPEEPKLFEFELPPLDSSDQPLLEQLKTKIAVQSLSLLVDDGLIERFVVTVDAITKDEIPYNLLPVHRPSGRYKVIEAEQALYSSTANMARYQPYLDLMAALPREHWQALYEHLYPLFQQAYERLGYPEQEFHSVLLMAIDKVLATPTPSVTTELVQPNVMYEFADPELQKNSTTLEKLMLRLGPESNRKVKAMLLGVKKSLIKNQ